MKVRSGSCFIEGQIRILFFSKVRSGSCFFEGQIRILFFFRRSDPDPIFYDGQIRILFFLEVQIRIPFFYRRSDLDPAFSPRSDPDPVFFEDQIRLKHTRIRNPAVETIYSFSLLFRQSWYVYCILPVIKLIMPSTALIAIIIISSAVRRVSALPCLPRISPFLRAKTNKK